MDPSTAWAGVDRATRHLVDHLGDIDFDDRAARAPSHLPDWSNGHVLTHIARNADGFARMFSGVRQRQIVPMYPSVESRAEQIEEGADRPAAELVADVVRSHDGLAEVVAEMDVEMWVTPARRWGTHDWPAEDLLAMRWREVAVHSTDLDVGWTPSEAWSAHYVAHELSRQLVALASRLPAGQPVSVVTTDGSVDVLAFRPEPGHERPPVRVEGSRVEVLVWLLDRSRPAGWPVLGPWLGVP